MGKRTQQDGTASTAGGSVKTAASEGTQKSKKFKLQLTGQRTCELCDRSSEDSLDNPIAPNSLAHWTMFKFETLVPSLTTRTEMIDGTAWALYSEDTSGKRVPQESKCHRCHAVHLQAFREKAWEELVACKSDTTMKKKIERAFQPTRTQRGIGQVNRCVILMNERELRRECGAKKLSQKDLKAIPSFVLPKEDGTGTEQIWAFHDPVSYTHLRAHETEADL
eukprot:6242033-Amphidinium_carterae.2